METQEQEKRKDCKQVMLGQVRQTGRARKEKPWKGAIVGLARNQENSQITTRMTPAKNLSSSGEGT